MRYAIFSDVHANLRAWEQALADIRGQQADVLVCLGDVVGYGPKPEEVLRGIREITGNFVMGNHDAAAAGAMDYSMFNDEARHSIDWTSQALSAESREFLGAVPLAIDADDILFVHAEISEPGRFTYIDSLDSAEENFADSVHFLTFVGHTHHPNIFQLGADGGVSELSDRTRRLDPSNRYIVNVGSVGEPRNPEDLRGVYVIYDSETREVEFRRVSFDIEAYRNDLASTSLEVKPFFLQSYDHQFAETQASTPIAAQALAMQAPAAPTALVARQRTPVRLLIPSRPLALAKPGDAGTSGKHRNRKSAKPVVVTLTLIVILAIGSIIWSVSHFRGDTTPDDTLAGAASTAIGVDEAVTQDPGAEIAPATPDTEPEPEQASGMSPDLAAASVSPSPPRPEPAPPPPPPQTVEPEPSPEPAAPLDPTVAWWRMEEDSLGDELVDRVGRHTLPAQVPGSRIGRLAPPAIPANGAKNSSALGLGVWTEPDPDDVFELRADRSFTLEGWVLTDKPRRAIFLAGTRSGEANEGQGWHVDLRPPSRDYPNGQMCFFYDNGPEILQALSEDVLVGDLEPHHFAAVWDHDHSATAGEMRLLLDGEQVAATEVPHAEIAKSQANPFRIGARTNPPRLGMDELRFSQVALGPRRFLNTTPELVLLAESFENPEVDGYKSNSAPPGWIGSAAGFGSDKRGLIDQGDGAQFTTPHGQQAFILAYTNSGLTSGQSTVSEVLTAGSTYRVSFNVGVKKDETATYHVELVAFDSKHDNAARREARAERPGVVLGRATGEATANDLSQTGRIVFKPDVANPHLGKSIGVRLIKAKGNAIYDNVRLVSRTGELVPAAPGVDVSAAPAPAPKPSAPAPSPRPKGDPTIAWWRMEAVSEDGALVDAMNRHPLPAEAPGAPISALAPATIPANGIENGAALGLGVYTEPDPGGVFALRADRSFTLEGWVVAAKFRAPIFVAGTRSGEANDGQGWHIDIRPRTNEFPNGQMCFFYDDGPEIVQALSEDLAVGELEPHHFAAVWDHDATEGAGEMRLYLDGERIASAELPHSQIPAEQANPFRIGAPTNPPKVGLDEVRFSHAALGTLEFLRAETQAMTKNGKWADAANWSGGEPPSGTQTAVIGAGIAAEVVEAPPEFAGDLVLEKTARLTIRTGEAFAVIPDPPSKLVLHQGAALIPMTANNASGNLDLGPIELAGSATIWGGRSTSGHHARRVFSGVISGPGALVLDGVNNNEFILSKANSFRGGFVAKTTQKQGFHVRAKAAGSLGEGNVAIAANASLMLDAADAIAPQATLTLTGTKDNRSPAKVVLNANNTVTGLVIDGEKQAAGTWGAPGSGAEHEHEKFAGSGTLTVTR